MSLPSSDNSTFTSGKSIAADRRVSGESFIVLSLRMTAWLSILITLAIIVILVQESSGFFQHVSIFEFFGTEWAPLFEPRKFGILPLIYGTMFVAFMACIISVPTGVAIALYLSEYASTRFRRFFKPFLEILAGIPSIVFGYFAVTSITPLLREVIPETQVFNALSAGIVVGIMNLPMVASLTDDAFNAVPQTVRDSGYAMGATKFEVLWDILIPAAASGIMAAFILAFSRAIGETMAVTLAAGATPQMTLNPLDSIQTMTAYIVQVSMGDVPHGSIEYQSIFVVGLILFGMTLIMNLIAKVILKRLRQAYT